MQDEIENHCYLGDGVYVEFRPDEVVLRTGDHREEHCGHQIFIDNKALTKLFKFLAAHKKIELEFGYGSGGASKPEMCEVNE